MPTFKYGFETGRQNNVLSKLMRRHYVLVRAGHILICLPFARLQT